MKTTDVSWRFKIGSTKLKNKSQFKTKSSAGEKIITTFATTFFVLILLIIGNIEINPGPFNYKDINLSMIIDQKARSTELTSNSPVHPNSCWGSIAECLLGYNVYSTRLFLSKFYKFNCNEDKLRQISISQLLNEKSNLISDSQNNNFRLKKSVWGILEHILLQTNIMRNREFLFQLSKLYQEFEPIFDAHNVSDTDSTVPQTSHNKDRKRKSYRKEHYNNNPNKLQSESFLSRLSNAFSTFGLDSEIQTPEIPQDQIEDLKLEYQNSIFNFTSVTCQICHKMVYPDAQGRGINSKFKPQIFVLNTLALGYLTALGDQRFQDGDRIETCHRCYSNLQKGKIPPQALCNGLKLQDIPECISCLNDSEVALITQVRVFLKIILLNKGMGQKALRGMAVHFPQEIEEVIEQLPLTTIKADVLFVVEENEGSDFIRKLEVSPAKMIAALQFLKENNPLYSKIEIVERDPSKISPIIIVNRATKDNDNNLQLTSGLGFTSISTTTEILRGTIHQGNPLFGENAGKQCTAMCGAFLAYACIESPRTWFREKIDTILSKGNKLYSTKRPNATDDYLTVEDIDGPFFCYEGVGINIKPIPSENINQIYGGYLNKFYGPTLNRLPEQIAQLINSGHKYAILQTNNYSMAFYIEEDTIYMFDSHNRGKKGATCHTADGTACILKCNVQDAPAHISRLIHTNCQPKGNSAEVSYQFLITPMIIERILNNNSDTDSSSDSEREENIFPSPHVSPKKKKVKVTADCDEVSSDSDTEDQMNLIKDNLTILKTIQGGADMDCVIQEDDHAEPDIAEYNPNQVKLKRKKKQPIDSRIEKNLEELAFPQLFPFGKDGLNQERPIKLTPLDYFQQRLMSAYKRFIGRTDYLFYALSECDRYRAFQKINVCCNMQREVGQAEDVIVQPHLYMSGIRGTAAYWSKYTGDLIAMIKTLGTPTFFLTKSFDDLNSYDTVNALLKAKYGYDYLDVDPTTLSYEERKQLLNDYPIVAARHFSMRLTKWMAFLQKHSEVIFGRKLLDYSCRVEFQSRGSPHAHMIIWLENVPDWNTQEGIEFLDENVSCSLQSPIANLVRKFQSHRHTSTCFKNKNQRCRFNFPISPCEETQILGDEEIQRNGGRFVRLQRTLDEAMINNYHPKLLQIDPSNMDIQACTSSMAIAYYIAKYISKKEPNQIQQEIQESVTKIMESDIPIRQKMYRISIQIMKRRQVSAQEAAFRMCHLFLRKSTRKTVFLPTFRKENRLRMIRKETLNDESPQFCTSLIDRYTHRPDCLENLCLFEFASYYQPITRQQLNAFNDDDVEEFGDEDEEINEGQKPVYNCKFRDRIERIEKRNRAAVVKTPNFHPVADRDNYLYSLILMYYPFREENFVNEDQTIEQAFQAYNPDFRRNSDDPCINSELCIAIDQALLRLAEFNYEEGQDLGLESQLSVGYVDVEDNLEDPMTPENVFPKPAPNIAQQIQEGVTSLNSEQKIVFKKFADHIKCISENRTVRSLKLICHGPGGTGKSHILSLLTKYIQNFFGRDSIIIAAPTGKAAHAIGGLTLHRAFSLPLEINGLGRLQKLSGRRLQELRSLYSNVKFIFIDELSLINYQTLKMIHLRLVEIMENEEPFAGLNICLMGDLLQMKCVRGTYIFQKPPQLQAEAHLWRMFDFVELSINQRHNGNDPLRDICLRLRVGQTTQEDIEILQDAILRPSDPNYLSKIKHFEDAIWAFPTIKLADRYNEKKSIELSKQTRIYKICAHDTYADGSKFGKDCPKDLVPNQLNKTAGIPTDLELGIGSRIMLRRNKNVDNGLVNGAVGTVIEFEWNYGRHQVQPGDLPRSVKIKFDHLHAPVDVSCMEFQFCGKKNVMISRRMMPLILSWGQNFHKLQGITVDKIVLDLGPKLFAKGMAYVALSRVRSLSGLAITNLDVKKLITTAKYTPCDLVAVSELDRLRSEFLEIIVI